MDYNMSDLVYYVLLEKESKSSKASGGHLADQRSVRRMKNTIKWHTSSMSYHNPIYIYTASISIIEGSQLKSGCCIIYYINQAIDCSIILRKRWAFMMIHTIYNIIIIFIQSKEINTNTHHK